MVRLEVLDREISDRLGELGEEHDVPVIGTRCPVGLDPIQEGVEERSHGCVWLDLLSFKCLEELLLFLPSFLFGDSFSEFFLLPINPNEPRIARFAVQRLPHFDLSLVTFLEEIVVSRVGAT